MGNVSSYRPDFSHIRPLLLAMAEERSSERFLDLTVNRLAAANNIVVARAWLKGPGDLCASCSERNRCLDRESCLHLVATAVDEAHGDVDPDVGVRMPLSSDAPGASAAGTSAVVLDLRAAVVLGHPMEWATSLGLRGSYVAPLRHHDEYLGCLEVLTAGPIPSEGPEWLQVIADHAAAALANSRAFEEIERLRRRLAQENRHLRAEIKRVAAMGPIVGAGPAVRELLRQVELVAPTRATVLLLGESGTGKELLAHEIHAQSARAAKPFVLVNCASIPAQLYESVVLRASRQLIAIYCPKSNPAAFVAISTTD